MISQFGSNQDLETLSTAIRKFLNSNMTRSMKSGDYPNAMQFAASLLDDPEFGEQAAANFLGCSRALFPSDERNAAFSTHRNQLQLFDAYWEAMAEILIDMPSTPDTIETGFAILQRLPGHAIALAGLEAHITQLRPAADMSATPDPRA